MYRNRSSSLSSNPRLQRGFLIPLAMFIIMVIGVLSLAISRMGSNAKSTSILEAISSQAFYAAETGAQLAMHEIYFNAADVTTADANCSSLDARANLDLAVPGLAGCSVAFSCTLSTSGVTSVYDIEANASCGSGDYRANRAIAVSAYME